MLSPPPALKFPIASPLSAREGKRIGWSTFLSHILYLEKEKKKEQDREALLSNHCPRLVVTEVTISACSSGSCVQRSGGWG